MERTLAARYYTDPHLFREELDRFFFRDWICAGREAALEQPGDYLLREIAGESVIVTRAPDGSLRAFYNVCRHRGTRLCSEAQGRFPGRIQCPYHGWTYALTGELTGAPHMPSSFRRADYPLHPIRLAVWDGHIFLNLSEREAPPLDRQLGDLPRKFAAWRMQGLRMHTRITYDVRANWKLVIANYSECLHCPHVHPALHRLSDYTEVDNEAPAPTYIGGAMGFRSGVETMSTDGAKRRACLPGLNEGQQKQVLYYAIYPNLMLSLHPDYMMTHTLWPRAVDRTEVVCEWHFDPREMAKPGFEARDAIEFWDATNREDWRMVELSQAGIESRAYTPGPYSERESLLSAFDRVVLERERETGG